MNLRSLFEKHAPFVTLAVLFGAILFAWISPKIEFDFRSIDQGWATLIAAFFGFSAIAYQTRSGFKSIVYSQGRQSMLDREARDHQHQLDTEAEQSRRSEERKALAGSLAAELKVAATAMRMHVDLMSDYISIFRELGNGKAADILPFHDTFLRFDALVFKENVGRIGILGPTLASEVIFAYQRILFRPAGPTDKLDGNKIADLVSNYQEIYRLWLTSQPTLYDQLHSAAA